jgi:hypothetical protein
MAGTPRTGLFSIQSWAKAHRRKFEQWLSAYTIDTKSKNVALILAGNIPLVGFHDSFPF